MSQVYDCVLWNCESELWDIRRHELAGVVHYHVVLESSRTFAGNPKQLRFDQCLGFEVDQIHSLYHGPDGTRGWRTPEGAIVIWLPVRDTPREAKPWPSEHFERNALLRILSLSSVDPMSLILLSDADEIPSAESVRLVQDNLGRGAAAFRQQLSY